MAGGRVSSISRRILPECIDERINEVWRFFKETLWPVLYAPTDPVHTLALNLKIAMAAITSPGVPEMTRTNKQYYPANQTKKQAKRSSGSIHSSDRIFLLNDHHKIQIEKEYPQAIRTQRNQPKAMNKKKPHPKVRPLSKRLLIFYFAVAFLRAGFWSCT